MSNIKVQCIDQAIGFLNTPVISSGNVNYDTITFEFCSKWDGFTKTAIFYRTKDEVYYQILDESNTCNIPNEVLGEKGVIYIGVFGSSGDTTITSQVLKYRIDEGAITEDLRPSDPTPDIYDQILALCSQIRKEQTDFITAWEKTIQGTRDEMIAEVEKIIENENVGDATTVNGITLYKDFTEIDSSFNNTTPIIDIVSKMKYYSKLSVLVWSGSDEIYPSYEGARDGVLEIDRAGNYVSVKFTLLGNGGIRTGSCYTVNSSWSGWNNPADGGNADTVDGYHASDFTFGLPKNSAKYVANAENCPNGFKDIKTNFGRNISVYVETNVSDMPTSGSYWTVYIAGTGIVNHVIAVGKGGMYYRIYYDSGSYDTGWQSFLSLNGGILNGTLALMEFLNVHSANSDNGVYSSFIQHANGTHVRHVTDANNFDEFFIRKGKITYAKMVDGTWSETEVLNTGNSSPVVPTNVDPGVGASVTYADNTVIFVYEEE